jgi:deazaflavin-dependent oxidoreductase (nitroreductase family)
MNPNLSHPRPGWGKGFGVPQVHKDRLSSPQAAETEANSMTTKNESLTDRLSRYREINLTVTGRKSGRAVSNPVWFVFEDGQLYLLPVTGSDSQWYKNVLKNPKITVLARGLEAELRAQPITDHKQVSSVIEKFRGKYADDVKKYYSKFDVAVVAEVNSTL